MGEQHIVGGYAIHPAAELFPMLTDEDLRDLAEDIKVNGLGNPITLINDDGEQKVLDGRNRLRACELAEVPPRFVTWTGTSSPISWVVSQNLHRRHLTESQRAEVAVGLVPLFEKEARERQGRPGQPRNVTATVREQDKGTAAKKAAAAVGVSERLVQSALKVQREGTPELVAAVKRGEVAVSAAVKGLRSPPKLPTTKKSKPPKASPFYTLLLTMPTEEAAAVSKQLRALGFESVRNHASQCDAEMALESNPHKRTA